MLAINFYPSLTQRLRNAEHYNLFGNIVTHGETKGIKPDGLKPAWGSFTTVFAHEDLVYKRAGRREETILIRKSHEKRKTSYMALKRFFEVAAYSETSAVKDASTAILEMMENYASAYYAPMNEASALFVNLLEDFDKPHHAAQLALITGADAYIDRLQRDNNDFMTLYAERTYVKEEIKVEGTMTDARKAVDREFVKLIGAINTFYRYNEMQQTKDPEVSAALTDMIMFINSFLHQYEETYARRSPGSHLPKDDIDPSEPGEGGEDEPAIPAIPQFTVDTQEVVGENPAGSGYGAQMLLTFVDAEAFASVLYPVAYGGVLRLLTPNTTDNYVDFPIADFASGSDGTTPVGILVNPPDSTTDLYKPFNSRGVTTAGIYKDGEHLAVVLEAGFPYTIAED